MEDKTSLAVSLVTSWILRVLSARLENVPKALCWFPASVETDLLDWTGLLALEPFGDLAGIAVRQAMAVAPNNGEYRSDRTSNNVTLSELDTVASKDSSARG